MFPRLQPSQCYEELPYSYFRPTSSTRLRSRGTIPLIRPIMILYCFTLYSWYFCSNSQRSGPYFVVFSSFFFSRFVTHGQLISSVMTRFDSWLIMRSSTLLAVFASYTGFGFSGEYQGGTESTRPRSCKISKKSIFRGALCRVTYLFCARAIQPANT